MVISAYQVNNVIRVYHDQLRNSKITGRTVNNSALSPDRVTISDNAKKKSVSDKIASIIANKIDQYTCKDEIGKEFLDNYEDDPEIQPNTSQNVSADLMFKMIDDGGETIRLVNIEDIKYS